MFFQEPRSTITEAGWFCGCGYRILVRQSTKSAVEERRETLAERRAKALRNAMTTQARAERLGKERERLHASRRRSKR